MDLTGVARTIDHAIYTMLNAIAIVFWRLDAALLGMASFGYRTQDWLTGSSDGGLWFVLARLLGADGLVNQNLWRVFVALALILYALGKISSMFFRRESLVDVPKLMLYAALTFWLIGGGAEMMRSAETWRGEAGSWIYSAVGDVEPPSFSGAGGGDDPIATPIDLDGNSPLRGWEAVASSYYLADSQAELSAGVPPEDFRRTYCLYDPTAVVSIM